MQESVSGKWKGKSEHFALPSQVGNPREGGEVGSARSQTQGSFPDIWDALPMREAWNTS